jgi:hypothetical protein
MDAAGKLCAQAVIAIDTLWGGDVMCASGTGRFIADSWFSGEPLPDSYHAAGADRLRETGGVGAKTPDRAAASSYLAAADLPSTLTALGAEARSIGGLRGEYLEGLALCFQIMYELALEILGEGPAVPYERSVMASTGKAPEPSQPQAKRQRVAELLSKAGFAVDNEAALLAAVDQWRAARAVPMASVKELSNAVIAYFDRLSAKNLAPYLPAELAAIPRANIEFLPIHDAWFSGSMNYVGRARNADGSPRYEATYEINASLSISTPEFFQLISHEVVPGHVTTFAYLQDLYRRGLVGFEASVLTMNTRAASLFEGIANNAILIAHGVNRIEELPGDDLQLGTLLALLQDDAKNQSSYLTWGEKRPQAEVAATLRRDFLVSEERAGKLSGAWGRHPLLGRMYLPAYRCGTEKLAALRQKLPDAKILPALYGIHGLVDIVTLDKVL